MTLTDAAAHGLPVIATNTGGVPDIVKHRKSGVLVRTEHEEDVALMSLTDPSTRKLLSVGALEQHRQVLNWDVWANHVSDVLANVVKSEARDTGKGIKLT